MRTPTTKSLALTLLLVIAFSAVKADQSQPLSLGPFEILPSGENRLLFAGGAFNLPWSRNVTGEGISADANLEYRFGKKFYYVGFALGGLANTEGGGFVYVGNHADIRYGKFVATPLLSVGAYSKGAGLDLGGTLQFRSSVTIAYEFQDGSRVGIRMAHISNAGIHDENPGVNELLLTFDFPF